MTEKGDVIYPRTHSLLLAGIGLKPPPLPLLSDLKNKDIIYQI